MCHLATVSKAVAIGPVTHHLQLKLEAEINTETSIEADVLRHFITVMKC